MSRFIKLSTIVINTNYINKILINPNHYSIYLNNTNISFDTKINVCAVKSPIDYNIMSDWIKIECNLVT